MQPRPEDALHVFPYQVSEAAFLNGPDRTLFLFLLETTAAGLRVLQLSRAEGFRGQEVRNSNLVKLSISAQFQVQWSRREWEGVKLHHLHHGGSIANVGLILF